MKPAVRARALRILSFAIFFAIVAGVLYFTLGCHRDDCLETQCDPCQHWDENACTCLADDPLNCAHGSYNADSCKCSCPPGWSGVLCDHYNGNYLEADITYPDGSSIHFISDTLDVDFFDNAAGIDSMYIDG